MNLIGLCAFASSKTYWPVDTRISFASWEYTDFTRLEVTILQVCIASMYSKIKLKFQAPDFWRCRAVRRVSYTVSELEAKCAWRENIPSGCLLSRLASLLDMIFHAPKVQCCRLGYPFYITVRSKFKTISNSSPWVPMFLVMTSQANGFKIFRVETYARIC